MKMHCSSFYTCGSLNYTKNRTSGRLDSADQEKEAELLSEAYDMLISAYQESRELNDEMELLIKDALIS